MKDDPREIVTESISSQELKRRWRGVRSRMTEEKIDFLGMQTESGVSDCLHHCPQEIFSIG